MGLFSMGKTVATVTAIALLEEAGVTPQSRWNGIIGETGEAQRLMTGRPMSAMIEGDRLLSMYVVGEGTKVCIITEHDCNATTVMRAAEY